MSIIDLASNLRHWVRRTTSGHVTLSLPGRLVLTGAQTLELADYLRGLVLPPPGAKAHYQVVGRDDQGLAEIRARPAVEAGLAKLVEPRGKQKRRKRR